MPSFPAIMARGLNILEYGPTEILAPVRAISKHPARLCRPGREASRAHPRGKPGFSTFDSGCGRETDCLLEGNGFELSVPRRESNESHSGTGTVTEATKVRLEEVAYLPGTDGSNPFPSSSESCANQIRCDGARAAASGGSSRPRRSRRPFPAARRRAFPPNRSRSRRAC